MSTVPVRTRDIDDVQHASRLKSEQFKEGLSISHSISSVQGHEHERTRSCQRKSRWAREHKSIGLINTPNLIKSTLTSEQLNAFVMYFRIEELSQKLRVGDVIPTSGGNRSPSPPPQYDNFGKRINTRDARYRKKLEDERHCLVEKAMTEIPDYQPPVDYRRPNRTQEKVYVPVNDYPEINFIGLLIGPRGNTLKNMEKESGAKIAIRGRGSVKEGKGRNEALGSSLEEDLHCLIMADTEEKIQKAIELVNKIIETAASVPEAQNTLKKQQLRDLAAINGTLRDDENQPCQNCGEIGHRRYDCPHARVYNTQITCRICGGVGHMARDCRQRNETINNNDVEYERLISELGGRPLNNTNKISSWTLDNQRRPTAPWDQEGLSKSSEQTINATMSRVDNGNSQLISPTNSSFQGKGVYAGREIAAHGMIYEQTNDSRSIYDSLIPPGLADTSHPAIGKPPGLSNMSFTTALGPPPGPPNQ